MGSGLEGDLTFYVIGILMFSSSLGLQILMTIFDMIYQQAIGHGMSSSYLDNIRSMLELLMNLKGMEMTE